MLEEGRVLASEWWWHWIIEVGWNACGVLGYRRLMNRHPSTAISRCENFFGMAIFPMALGRALEV